MIFLSSLIQFAEINYHPITCNNSLWNQFIFIIRNNSNTSLLRDTMDRTYPLTISNGINYTCLQKLQYLFSYHFFHFRIQTSLRITNWFGISFQIYFMFTQSGTNALKIIQSVSNSSRVLLQSFNNISSSCSERLALIITAYIFFSSR